MYHNTITLAAAMLSCAALVFSAPLADNATVTVQASGSGEVCESWPLVDANGQGRGHYQCSKLPSGVKVRGVFSNGGTAVYTDWFQDLDAHYTPYVSNAAAYVTSMDVDKQDEDISNGDCVAIMHEEDVTGRNNFKVQLKCTRIRSGVKARGVLDMPAQTDEHTSWVNGPLGSPIDIESGWKKPSTLTNPKVRVDYELQS